LEVVHRIFSAEKAASARKTVWCGSLLVLQCKVLTNVSITAALMGTAAGQGRVGGDWVLTMVGLRVGGWEE